jgi:F0F1-type ATP synthase membrane subunit c/vacuolar-type H+-ATPase subunit K
VSDHRFPVLQRDLALIGAGIIIAAALVGAGIGAAVDVLIHRHRI